MAARQGYVHQPEGLLLCLLAVFAGAETMTDIARFGEARQALLRRFRPCAAGTPTHDHLGDILAVPDAELFQRCFAAWAAALAGVPKGVVAIDGKTSRRSKGDRAALHMLSAFAARQRLALARVKVADKSGKIVAIPKLLDLLAVERAVLITPRQRASEKILERRADHVLPLKGNRARRATTSGSPPPSRKPMVPRIPPSTAARQSMAITGRSRPATSPSSRHSLARQPPRLAP